MKANTRTGMKMVREIKCATLRIAADLGKAHATARW
jgi:hypothetical protein